MAADSDEPTSFTSALTAGSFTVAHRIDHVVDGVAELAQGTLQRVVGRRLFGVGGGAGVRVGHRRDRGVGHRRGGLVAAGLLEVGAQLLPERVELGPDVAPGRGLFGHVSSMVRPGPQPGVAWDPIVGGRTAGWRPGGRVGQAGAVRSAPGAARAGGEHP
ncbi:MAG: hypothetical protein R2755_13185 [Acidimicrobiales bacterium]